MDRPATLPRPVVPVVAADEVQVWRLDLLAWAPWQPELEGLLSDDECARADRFVFARDRDRHVLSRGLLRVLLAHQLGVDAAGIGFAHGSHGKPALLDRGVSDLRFNVSHSGDWLFIALACGHDVGVDVEQVRAEVAWEQIAEQFFTAAETASIRGRPVAAQAARFFECWVRKEAALKAWGMGLSLELNRFEVSAGPKRVARLEAPAGTPGAGRLWSIRTIDAPPGYEAAVVVEGDDSSLSCVSWPTA